MKKSTLAATLLLLSGSGVAHAQSVNGAQGEASAPMAKLSLASASDQPVEQVQANPPGTGPISDTPPNPDNAQSPVPRSMPADPSYQGGAYKGALSPPPAEAMSKDYPLCTRTIQDSCINPSEAGTRTATSRHMRKHRRTH